MGLDGFFLNVELLSFRKELLAVITMRIIVIIKAYNNMIMCWGACLRVIFHSGLGSHSVYISTAKSVRCCLLTRFHIVLDGLQQRTVRHGAVGRIADFGAAAGILIPRSESHFWNSMTKCLLERICLHSYF